MALAETVDLLDAGHSFGRDRVLSPIASTLVIEAGSGDVRQLLESSSEAKSLRFEAQSAPITAFGQLIELPLVETTVKGVTPSIVGEPVPSSEGEAVRVKWLPADGFTVSRRFLTQRVPMAAP